MDCPPPAPSPDDVSAPCSGEAGAVAAARTGRHLRMLARLAEMGMDLAEAVHRQALESAQPAAGPAGGVGPGPDPGLAFARIARAVRQTIALEAKLAADAQAPAQPDMPARTSRLAAERKRAKQHKERVRHLVGQAIADATDAGDAEGLLLDLDERLEDPDVEAELASRPIGVVVAGICADLGIEADLSHFTDAELGFDTASMSPAGGPDGGPDGSPDGSPNGNPVRKWGGEADGDSRLASAHIGRAADPAADPRGAPDPGGAADTGGPPASLSSSLWPARAGTGHDPP